MKNIKLLAIFSLMIPAIYAQNKAKIDYSKEIDKEIWQVFQEAYDNYEAKKYNDLHSDDVLRIGEWGIRSGEEYKSSITQSFSREDKTPRKIDFVFEHRIYKENIAYEVGYYRVVYSPKKDDPKTHYGRFHVVIKKINGKWKIAQDWDTSNINGHEVSATDFERLRPKE